MLRWWKKRRYSPPEENECGYKTVTVELTFKRNVWTADNRPLHDQVIIQVAGWAHPHISYHDKPESFWVSLLDRIEGKAP